MGASRRCRGIHRDEIRGLQGRARARRRARQTVPGRRPRRREHPAPVHRRVATAAVALQGTGVRTEIRACAMNAEQSVPPATHSTTDVARIKMLIGGAWRAGTAERDVIDPFRGSVVARAPESSLRDLDDALSAATSAKKQAAAMPAFERAAILRKVAALLVERADDI